MIPARAITRPSLRTLEMLTRQHGLFNQLHEPFVLSRALFRINEQTLRAPGVEEALEVLDSLAPSFTTWFGEQLVDLGEQRGVWRVHGRFWQPSRSRRLDADGLVEHVTPLWYATVGLTRFLPDGMHRITAHGRRTLLQPRPYW